MIKTILSSLAISAVLYVAPAAAQSAMMDCNEANMMKANTEMGKMVAGEKKTMAMGEMTMAKDMMAKKDMAACKTHMNKAMEMGKSK